MLFADVTGRLPRSAAGGRAQGVHPRHGGCRVRRIAGTTLASLAAGNVVSEAAVRSAGRVMRFGTGRLGHTKVSPVGESWTELPPALRQPSVTAALAQITGLSPRLVRPKVAAELVWVLPVAPVAAGCAPSPAPSGSTPSSRTRTAPRRPSACPGRRAGRDQRRHLAGLRRPGHRAVRSAHRRPREGTRPRRPPAPSHPPPTAPRPDPSPPRSRTPWPCSPEAAPPRPDPLRRGTRRLVHHPDAPTAWLRADIRLLAATELR